MQAYCSLTSLCVQARGLKLLGIYRIEDVGFNLSRNVLESSADPRVLGLRALNVQLCLGQVYFTA